MSVLSATQVTHSFSDGTETFFVLKGVSLELSRGEIVVLEGPSGSGKTTFLSILGCILTPTTGSVMVDGVTAEPHSLAAIRKRSIGFVFQQYNLFPALTAVENVEYALNVKGRTGNEARREAEQLIDQVGLSDRRGFLPCDLSGGQKQRVAIARSLAAGPSVILADEPTANLDTRTGSQILELFRMFASRENRAMLVVTHDPRVRAISDRVVRIQDGVIQ